MKSTSFALRTAVFLALLLGVALGMTRAGSAGTPTAGQDSHHRGTPGPTSACALYATPTSGGMNMGGTPHVNMMMDVEFDLAFIDMMIPHHEGAVAMARIALERGEHQEVRLLAQDIISGQDAEITQLESWRAEWYPDAPLVTMSGMMQMKDMGRMMPGTQELMESMGTMQMDPASDAAALCTETESFDRAFIDMMIPHHESAIRMAESALTFAQHLEIKEMAQEIIDAQRREISQMKEWRADWYGDATAAATDVEAVTVTLGEFSVTSSLTEFKVNQSYRFVVKNEGAIPHELMVLPDMTNIGKRDMEERHHVALAVVSEEDLGPGATAEVQVMFTEPGRYLLGCALPAHFDAGMKLAITVR